MLDCPSQDQLVSLLAEELDEVDQESLLAHLSVCERCCNSLDQLA